MTNSQLLKETQEWAIAILMRETFDHIQQEQFSRYNELVVKNNRIHKTKGQYFCYEGTLYPVTDQLTSTSITYLHWSLLEEFTEIQKLLTDSFYKSVKNYFTAVIGASCNSLVLTALLPDLLVCTLKKQLNSTLFSIIDCGIPNTQEPKEYTLTAISNIKKYYPNELKQLHSILMDKLLLQ
jgi:hypothetical protein